jgi:tetratricopeptide (TPR) repeat protein/IS1 family transposase
MDLIHQLDAPTTGPPSGSPVVVMVQSTHDRKSNHFAPCILRGRSRSAPFRDLLRNPLMRPCLVEVGHIGLEDALELPLLQDQQVVQTVLPHPPGEALADRIGSGSMIRCVEHLHRTGGRDMSEARHWFEEMLALTDSSNRVPARAAALFGAGTMAWVQGDLAIAHARLGESVAFWRELADKRGLAYSLTFLGLVTGLQGNHTAGCLLQEESSMLFREIGDLWGLALSLYWLGAILRRQHDYTAASSAFEESLAIFRKAGDKWGLSLALQSLGIVAYRQGDYVAARSKLEEGLQLGREVGDKWDIAHILNSLGMVLQRQGDYGQAASLFEESLALHREVGDTLGIAFSLRNLASLAQQQGDYGHTMALSHAVTALRLYALGPAIVYRGETALTPSDWTYAKVKELLFYLLCHRSRTKEQIGLALWPDASPTQLRGNLHNTLYHLRHVLWLWLAIDPLTKLVPVLRLGPRTQHMAHLLIHSLRESMASGCLPLFTSDGLNLYFYALTAHFGQWLLVDRRGRNVRQWQVAANLIYGQVKKCYRQRKLVRVTPVMRLGTEADLKAALQGLAFSGRLNTAFIERVNLTVRHGVSALARRTWATAQLSPPLLAHLEWWRAYYHFVRPHQALRVALVQPRERGGKLVAQRFRQRTPAMAAGRTNRRWTAREVLSCPLVRISA